MLLELVKDYLLLATGAMIGVLLSGMCRAAAFGDRHIDVMGYMKNVK